MGTWSDVIGMLKDKRLLLGVAAAGGVGLVVFLRKQQSGKTGDAVSLPTGGSGGFVSSAPYGSVDTTGTDIAGFLSNWGDSMLDAVNASKAAPSTGGGSDQPSLRPWWSSTIREGEDVDKWISAHNLRSVEDLLALNPALMSYVKQADNQGYLSATNPLDPGSTHSVFNVGTALTVKVPYN